MAFKFEIGQSVVIEVSGERGQVFGRAEYAHSESNYLLRYVHADGRAAEAWWQESSLKAAD